MGGQREEAWYIVKVSRCFEVTKKGDGTPLTPFLSLKLDGYKPVDATCGSREKNLWPKLQEALKTGEDLNVLIQENPPYHNVIEIEGVEEGQEPGREGAWSPDSRPAGPAAPPPASAEDQRAVAKKLAVDTRALITVAAGLYCHSAPGSTWKDTVAMVERYVIRGEL